MTFVWKDKALRAASRRGVAKARAYGLATNRRAPITLARVRFLERSIIPASERELTGKAPTRDNSSVPARGSGQTLGAPLYTAGRAGSRPAERLVSDLQGF
jgi:hypothetical protein